MNAEPGVATSAGRADAFLLLEEALDDDGVILGVGGELDVATAPRLRQRLREIHDRGIRKIVLDLSEVTFIDSLSLAAVVAVRTRLGPDGRMAIVASHRYVLLIFEAGGLEEVLDLFPSRDEAVAHVRG